ncbi:hypothetical protein B4U37_19665 [Sutcliffiella horikoshii]|uniref:DUF4747 family protein n=1 Tax=Sutcliffiella horikoshii TaxID=79883 RepID=A0ABM6KNH5_9BACI|nr:hypothetical protein [Sutcliffiella horikoshii]ART78119.1 hypothetical protein B4U37_19665 [Sutcliffiella horikoshii]
MTLMMYFSKVNVNSNIFDVYAERTSIQEIMDEVFNKIDNKTEYKKLEERTFINSNNELETIDLSEVYNFSELTKVKDADNFYITGKLVRRYPLHTEEWDDKKRESLSVTHSNNSISIYFYFDLNSEVISFCQRNKFGYKQFNESFQELLNIYLERVGFEIFLLKDPFTIEERLKQAYKVERIKSTVIPPNNNNEDLRKLYDDDVVKMEEGNIQKKISVFEVHQKSKTGININSTIVKQVLDSNRAYEKYARGYGSIEVNGVNKDGTKFYFNSEQDSPYRVSIYDNEKEDGNKFIKKAKIAISSFLTKMVVEKFDEGE